MAIAVVADHIPAPLAHEVYMGFTLEEQEAFWRSHFDSESAACFCRVFHRDI